MSIISTQRPSQPAGDLPGAAKAVAAASPRPLQAACSACNLSGLCFITNGLPPDDLQRLDRLVETRRNVGRGEVLFKAGDPFDALYAVRTGFFKASVKLGGGREQIIGFRMAGELLGLDAIDEERHRCDAVALEDSQVCVIPYSQLQALAQEMVSLRAVLQKAMSREIALGHGLMLLLGSLRAEERVAAFVLNLALRLQARGFSASDLVLRMTRAEIGSYLGLKLETVSRMFSKFHEDGLLEVSQRHVRVRDEAGLRRLAGAAA